MKELIEYIEGTLPISNEILSELATGQFFQGGRWGKFFGSSNFF